MSKHTPGPWALSSGASHVIAARGGGICKLDSIHGAYQDQAANAHLIAAAPDMLEALKRIEYGLTQDARTADGWTKADAVACAQAAIAKAEG